MALLLGALALGTTTVTLPALAQSDAALAEARQRFDEGLKYADENNHEAARLKFSQAWAVFKSPPVLYNLARSEQLTGHDLEALEHFREFSKMGADPKITDAQRAKAKENIVELEKKVGQIDFDVPPGALLKVDGKALAEVPREPLPIAPGKHTVEAMFEGKVRSVTIECAAGARTKAKLVFESGSITEPPPEGEPTFWSTGRTVGAILMGAGVVGVGVGIGFQLASSSTKDDAARTRESLSDQRSGCFGDAANGNATCDGLRSLEDDYKTQSALRTTFIGAGAALLVGGAALFIVSGPGRKEPTRGARLIPVASGKEAGVVLLGQF